MCGWRLSQKLSSVISLSVRENSDPGVVEEIKKCLRKYEELVFFVGDGLRYRVVWMTIR